MYWTLAAAMVPKTATHWTAGDAPTPASSVLVSLRINKHETNPPSHIKKMLNLSCEWIKI